MAKEAAAQPNKPLTRGELETLVAGLTHAEPVPTASPTKTVSAVHGNSTGNIVLATFTDGDPNAVLAELTASVNWGGAVVGTPKVWLVLVSRTASASTWQVVGYAVYANPDYYFGYDSKAYRDLLAKYNSATNAKERTKLLGDIQRQIATDSVNAFLFQLPQVSIAKKGLKGLWSSSPIFANDMAAVSWQ